MANKYFCQSCSMPLDDPDLWGTEIDGSRNHEYCKYCYQDGQFTNPELTLEGMKEHMMKVVDNKDLPPDIVERAIKTLPFLKRWRSKVTIL